MARQTDGSTDTVESDFEQVCQPAAPQVTQLWYKKLDNTLHQILFCEMHSWQIRVALFPFSILNISFPFVLVGLCKIIRHTNEVAAKRETFQ